jgi:hypothetical protein
LIRCALELFRRLSSKHGCTRLLTVLLLLVEVPLLLQVLVLMLVKLIPTRMIFCRDVVHYGA